MLASGFPIYLSSPTGLAEVWRGLSILFAVPGKVKYNPEILGHLWPK